MKVMSFLKIGNLAAMPFLNKFLTQPKIQPTNASEALKQATIRLTERREAYRKTTLGFEHTRAAVAAVNRPIVPLRAKSITEAKPATQMVPAAPAVSEKITPAIKLAAKVASPIDNKPAPIKAQPDILIMGRAKDEISFGALVFGKKSATDESYLKNKAKPWTAKLTAAIEIFKEKSAAAAGMATQFKDRFAILMPKLGKAISAGTLPLVMGVAAFIVPASNKVPGSPPAAGAVQPSSLPIVPEKYMAPIPYHYQAAQPSPSLPKETPEQRIASIFAEARDCTGIVTEQQYTQLKPSPFSQGPVLSFTR